MEGSMTDVNMVRKSIFDDIREAAREKFSIKDAFQIVPEQIFRGQKSSENCSYVLEDCPTSVIQMPLSKAEDTYGLLIRNALLRCLRVETDSPTVFNHTSFASGLFVYVPANTIAVDPLKIVNNYYESSAVLCIFVGKNSSTHFDIDENVALAQSRVIYFFIEEGAKVTFTAYCRGNHQTLFSSSLRAELKKQAQFFATFAASSGRWVRFDASLSLIGEGAHAELQSLCTIKKDQEMITSSSVLHLAQETTSKTLSKMLVDETGRGTFNGNIHVAAQANESLAEQLSKNLLLSPEAQVTTKPNLDILTTNVRASHGACVGKLDEEAILYATARGLSEEQAKKLLIEAFCEEVLKRYASKKTDFYE